MKTKVFIPTASDDYLEYDENGVVNPSQLNYKKREDHEESLIGNYFIYDYNKHKIDKSFPIKYLKNDIIPPQALPSFEYKKRSRLK